MYPSDLERQETADRLRKVPTEVPPPYDWLEFRRREQIRGLAARSSRASNGLPYLAVAATLLVVVVGTLAFMSHRRPAHVLVHAALPAESPRTAYSQRNADWRTEDAERWLASLPPEPVIVRFGTRVAVTRLEDRIAQVDDLLTAANVEDAQPARVAELRQERGLLVNSLAQVRYAEALAANAP